MTLHVDPATLGDTDDVDTRVLASLRTLLGAEIADSWFCRLRIDAIEGRRAVVSLPTNFLKTWVTGRYAEALLRALRGVEPAVETFEVVVRTAARIVPPRPERSVPALIIVDSGPVGVTPAPAPRAKPVEGTRDPVPSSPLDRRLTFATFLVGCSNRLAVTAAKTAAEHVPAETPRWTPLFIHGAVGLGKTHLLQAIAQEAILRGRRVVYLTAEKFMYGFALALKAQTVLAFQERLRDVDILLIDDAQFLQGKSIQQEFAHTINAMVSAGRQIVVAADRPSQDLEHLDDRVRSRLAGGLAVEIGALDPEVRLGILYGHVEAACALMPGFAVPEPVLEHVAALIQTNGRDLAGAVNRLVACFGSSGSPLSVSAAEDAIRDLVRQREPKRVRIEDIQKLVATHYNVRREDILSARRTANIVRPRQIAMYLSKVLTLRSLPEIGRRFGGRDHTTVLHAVRKIEGLEVYDRELREELRTLKAMLED